MAMAARRRLEVWKLGVVPYAKALKLQNELVERRRAWEIPDTLLSLQHPPTYTLGKRRTVHNILASPDTIRALGVEIHYTERGGDVTFHGPGQAILYPILSLRASRLGVRRYVEGLEDSMTCLASLYHLTAHARVPLETGVWIENRKIGAVGVHISSGSISSHGLAFNIDPDLGFFQHIIPCGIPDKSVTSLKKESLIELPNQDVVTRQLIDCFVSVFGYEEVDFFDKAKDFSDND